jgi:hypothetical protein
MSVNVRVVLLVGHNKTMCHNPIFTHRIFSGVGMQNETARTESA